MLWRLACPVRRTTSALLFPTSLLTSGSCVQARGYQDGEVFVKRVVATGGDVVEVKLSALVLRPYTTRLNAAFRQTWDVGWGLYHMTCAHVNVEDCRAKIGAPNFGRLWFQRRASPRFDFGRSDPVCGARKRMRHVSRAARTLVASRMRHSKFDTFSLRAVANLVYRIRNQIVGSVCPPTSNWSVRFLLVGADGAT